MFLHLTLLAALLATSPGPADLQPIGPGLFQIGLVTIDANTRSITIPVEVNMNQGPVEYLLVADGGKLHESILRTAAQPLHLHLAMILLGFPEKPLPPPQPPPGQRPGLFGVPIEITVRFPNTDPLPASNLIHKTEGLPFHGQPWIYNGSRLQGDLFLAQANRSIIALMEDFDALVNTRDIDRINDKIWRPHPTTVPPLGTAAELTLHFPQP
ncbi:MAG: YdjY domain-containing protein [Verrucomicrobiia bacterium]